MHYTLMSQLIEVLEEHNFNVLLYSSLVVDIAAQKSKLNLLIKVFENVDSIKSEQALELKKLAQCLDASPVIIGVYSKVGKLDSDSVYDRYGISTVNTECFEKCLDEVFPEKKQSKGRQVVEIRGEFLKDEREKKGITMRQLADKLGVTKDAVYMYETQRIKPQYDIARQIEDILGVDVIEKKTPFETPQEQFIKKMDSDLHKKFMLFDFNVYDFDKLGFDIGLKDNKDKVLLEQDIKNVDQSKKFSDFFKTFFAVISKKDTCEALTLTKKDILEADSKKEFIKLLKERA